MSEIREKIKPLVDLLDHQIRAGAISNGGGHRLLMMVLDHPDVLDRVMDLLDEELPEEEVLATVARWL